MSSSDQPSNAEWLPRDENGHFESGFEKCRGCDGTGTVQELIGDPNAPDDATGYDTLRSVKHWCHWCDGRGATYVEGCKRCGADDLHESSTPGPSIGRQVKCYTCGWTWDYA